MTVSKELSEHAVAHTELAISDPEKKHEPGNGEDEVENYEGRSLDFRTVMGIIV